jgi:hypothetical protein
MNRSDYLSIINRLIKTEILESKPDGKFWAREVKILKSLYSFYPNNQFWESVNLSFKLNSLAWFRTPDGQKNIREQFFIFKKQNTIKEDQIILPTKIGEDLIKDPSNRQTSLIDFLTN